MADEDFRRFGQGRHIVLALHGWFVPENEWGSLIPHLDGEHYTYVFPYFRGYGARKEVPGEHTIAEAASDVLALADRLGAERFSLVGHCLGGSVMQWVYAEAPERVRALVGIAPVPANGMAVDDEDWQVLSRAVEDAESRRAVIDYSTGHRHPSAWLDGMVRHSLEHTDEQAFADYLRALTGTDFHERIEGAEVPIKVLAGENDPALGEDAMLTTFGRWYPKLEIEVLTDAGHYPAAEIPVTTANSVEIFLDEH